MTRMARAAVFFGLRGRCFVPHFAKSTILGGISATPLADDAIRLRQELHFSPSALFTYCDTDIL